MEAAEVREQIQLDELLNAPCGRCGDPDCFGGCEVAPEGAGMKKLTPETQAVVDDLRRHQGAVELLFGHSGFGAGRPELSYALGRAISRLSLLDVTLHKAEGQAGEEPEG